MNPSLQKLKADVNDILKSPMLRKCLSCCYGGGSDKSLWAEFDMRSGHGTYVVMNYGRETYKGAWLEVAIATYNNIL